MNLKLTYIALMLYALCYALLFGTWAAIVFNKVPGADQIVTYIQIGLGTLSGHVLTLLGPRTGGGDAAAPAMPTGQGGFAQVSMLLIVAGAAAAALMMTGCATAPGAPKQTPQQIAAQVCPAAQITMANLSQLHDMSDKARLDLASIGPFIDAACDAAETVDMSSLQRMANTVFPTLIRITDIAPINQDEHDRIVLGLTIGQIVLAGALQAATPVAP